MAISDIKANYVAAGGDWNEFVQSNWRDMLYILAGAAPSSNLNAEISAELDGVATAAEITEVTNTSTSATTNIELPVYGTEFHLFEANPVTTTTSTSLQTKLTGTTSELPIGKYECHVTSSYNSDSNQRDIIIGLTHNGSAIGQSDEILRKEAKDTGGSYESTGTNQKHILSQSYFFDVTAPATQTFEVKYCAEQNGHEVSMWDTSIKIIRVS